MLFALFIRLVHACFPFMPCTMVLQTMTIFVMAPRNFRPIGLHCISCPWQGFSQWGPWQDQLLHSAHGRAFSRNQIFRIEKKGRQAAKPAIAGPSQSIKYCALKRKAVKPSSRQACFFLFVPPILAGGVAGGSQNATPTT